MRALPMLWRALWIAVFAVPLPTSAEVDILDYRLRDLLSSDAMELDLIRGGVSVLMFFEPDCPYCFRQARVLNELQRECPDLEPVAIGLNGDRRALQKEAARMRAEFPVLEIDERLQRDIGKVEATPLMLVGDRSGMLVTWLRGLQSARVLRGIVERVDPTVCRARGAR